MMAGLACGEVNPISFDILKNHADCFISCDDEFSARGMRMLAKPQGSDAAIVSGESGAIGTGLVSAIMEEESLADLRDALGLDENSVVLLFSTEGATDPENYAKVVGK